MPTRTGGFTIGFRRGRSEWQRDLESLAGYVASIGYEAVDLPVATPADLATLRRHGLEIGSVDLLDMGKTLQPDAGARRSLTERNVAHVRELAAAGVKAFLTVLIPDPPMTRAQGLSVAVEALAPVCAAAREVGAAVVVEGWPGPAPHYPSLGCTPETCRILLRELGPGLALNFDPSHLVRLGIDPVRFLGEFAPHVRHAHAKDTRLFPDAVYEFGLYQPAVVAKPHAYGEQAWRYTLPGRGSIDWPECLRRLKDAGFAGTLSVELEDEDYNGTEAGEKRGLVESLQFLRDL